MSQTLMLYRLRRWVWFALSIFTLSACMPALTAWAEFLHARTAWGDICSVTALQPTEDPAHSHASKGHCPFCFLQNHTPFLPAVDITPIWVANPLATWLPPLLLHAPRLLHAWSPQAARAPPPRPA